MGGAFLGGFAGGLANTLMIAQQRQNEQEYKKALIEQSKLQTKMLENKLQMAQYEQGMIGAVAQAAGIPLPPMPQQQQVQATPQQQPKQGLLGRIFNPQQPEATQTLQPTPVAAQQPLPQMMAQGQMKAQMNPDQAKALAKDIVMKKVFDLPPWESKHLAESGHVGQKVTVMTPQGPATLILNKRGEPIQAYSQPPEYGTINRKGLYGEEYTEFYPKTQPPGGGVMTAPPAQAIQRPPNPEEEKRLSELQGQIGRLNTMIDFAKDPKNVDAFGTIATQKHSAYQDESITGGAKRVGIEMIPKQFGGGPPRPEVSGFLADKQSFVNQLRNKEFGSALSAREYSEFLKETLSSASPQQFVAVTQKVTERLKGEYDRLNVSIQKPYGMRQKPSLGLNQNQEWIENGVKYRINPQTGRKQRWID